MDSTAVRRDSFTDFVVDVEPKLRRALVAGYGVDRGREASADALVYAWKKWDRVRDLANPAGYLYRVGQRIAKEPAKRHGYGDAPAEARLPWIEPGLSDGLATLTAKQRTAVVLHCSFDWTYPEIAEVSDMSVRSVRTHVDRGLAKLRRALEVSEDE
jgi:RNA polymerase sigma-70 factor (ECF subfamily)